MLNPPPPVLIPTGTPPTGSSIRSGPLGFISTLLHYHCSHEVVGSTVSQFTEGYKSFQRSGFQKSNMKRQRRASCRRIRQSDERQVWLSAPEG